MQAKQDKGMGERLDGLHEVPGGFHFNSDSVWEMLEQQLQPAAKRKNYYWYTVACILIVAGAVYFLLPGKNTAPAILPQAVIQQTSQPKINEPVLQIIEPAKKSSSIVQREQKSEPLILKKEGPVAIPVAIHTDTSQQVEAMAPIPNIFTPVPKQLTTQKTKPPVKRHRIIHLDELNSTAPPVYIVQAEEKKPFFSIPEKETEKPKTTLAPEQPTHRVFFFRTTKPQTNTITTDH